MRSHLARGCEQCLRSSNLWHAVVELCSRESAYRPLEASIRLAKSAYDPENSWKWLPSVAQFAKLVFDSFLQPSAVAVRSGGSERHLVHEAQPFVIDLRLESDPNRKRMLLTGQILNSEDPDTAESNVDVVLLSGNELIQRTLANSMGEFNLELRPEANQQLFINIRGQRAIGIALPDPDV